MGYLVHLQKFEGPLGLLLYLIRKEEMDIFDINVHEITRQYLDYIRMMKELDLEVAGEFVAMAATLIHIKSRMLLPQYNDEGEVVAQEDPRKELVQKLLEYQRYQEAGKKLYERPILGRDIWPSAVQFDWKDEGPGEVITEDEGLFSLIAAYRRSMRKMKRAVHNVRAKVQSIASRVMEIKDRLIVGRRVVLRELLAGEGSTQMRVQLLITFLSLLELGRMGFVSLFQSEVYGDIHIEAKKAIERNVLERVQEFESEGADEVANHIIDDAKVERIDMSQTDESDVAVASTSDTGESSRVSIDESLSFEEAATDDDILAAEEEIERSGGFASGTDSNNDEFDGSSDITPDVVSTDESGSGREPGADLA